MKRVLGVLALVIGAALIGWFIYNQLWPTEEFKTHFRSVFQLIVPIALLAVGWKWVRYDGRGIEEITPMDLDCPELSTARARATEAMPAFLADVERGIDGAFVKFPLITPRGLTEHIWAYVHSYRDGVFNVSLANQPVDDRAEVAGRRNVPQSEVEDWQIMQPDGKIRGAYSLIALFEYHARMGRRLSPRMKKQKSQLLDAG